MEEEEEAWSTSNRGRRRRRQPTTTTRRQGRRPDLRHVLLRHSETSDPRPVHVSSDAVGSSLILLLRLPLCTSDASSSLSLCLWSVCLKLSQRRLRCRKDTCWCESFTHEATARWGLAVQAEESAFRVMEVVPLATSRFGRAWRRTAGYFLRSGSRSTRYEIHWSEA
ncbi:hypothetical protein Bca101_037735 [Brassica carinata]